MKPPYHIPKLPHAFFRWYCQRELYEELHGDLEEFYYERAEALGVKKARLLYLWDVVRCCQPYAWRTSQSQNSNIIMFRNYFKTSFRSLMKNPLNTFINLFGLSAAIGICVLVYAFSQWTFRVDQFHEHKHEVYLATFFADRDGSLQQNGKTPLALGNMLREDFSQIKSVCRVEDGNVVIKSGSNVFHERVRYVDPEFLQMFTFPLKWGSPATLADVNSIILNEDMAIKYFGDQDPVGKHLLVKFDDRRSKTFTVTGVADHFPSSHTISFDFLVNFENLRVADPAYDFNDWSTFIEGTLIWVESPDNLLAVEQGMEKYRLLQNEVDSDWAIESFLFEPLVTLYERSGNMRNGISGKGYQTNFSSIMFMGAIGIAVLALACLNYINIAIVSATRRLKEIGLRKVTGASKAMVVVQFLAENIFVTFLALVMGVILGMTFFIPGFEYLISFNMEFSIYDPYLLAYLLMIVLLTGIASGIYPAFYISRFDAVNIFKGSVRFGKKNPLTKIFLGFELILASIAITCAVMFTLNSRYTQERSWGYNQEQALYAEVHDRSAYDQLSVVMARDSRVLAIAGSDHHLGRNTVKTVLELPEREYEVDQLSVGASYFEVLGIELKEGRLFEKDHESDKKALIVNETLLEKLTLEQPIGQTIKIEGEPFQVVGVVKDFHHYDFQASIEPTIFRVAEEDDYHYLSLKVKGGTEKETYEALQAEWINLFPEIPFQGGYQEDVWGTYFEFVNTHGKFWTVIAILCVLLTGLGLYGLITLNVTGRIKEFSIRKVMGAGLNHLASNILSQYVVLFTVALALGAPISYKLISFIFDFAYKYHLPIDGSGVITAIVILIGVLLGVVAIQLTKISRSNPASGLRAE